MLGFCSSPRFTEHDTGLHHPEQPERIKAVWTALCRAGFLNSPNPFPDYPVEFGDLPRAKQPMVELEFGMANEKWLSAVHTQAHIDLVKRLSLEGNGVLDQGDTPVSKGSYEIALLAVGGVLRGCDAVMKGQVRRSFAAIRPPGHHAEPDRTTGFCFFCNAAIAAKYVQQVYGVNRVAIVDFDVHHGNGTQACFSDDPSVFFVSLHQNPRTCFPGTGFDWEIGVGRGRGATLNLTFNAGEGDVEYMKVVDTRLVPQLDEFRPEVVILSAGFDAHKDDPMAQIELTEEGFELMTRSLAALADQHAGGRVISILEGGYNMRALGRSVVRHMIGLGG
jgi:acetoin utilization deacetylase AcuC-like enzyme